MKAWIVRLGFSTTIVKADTSQEARSMLAEAWGYKNKPWVSREWKIREATRREIKAYAAMAAAAKVPKSTASPASWGNRAEGIESKLL